MAKRHLLILDGYNVIHAIPELRKQLNKSLETARDGLNVMVREWIKKHPGWEALIVYDGQSIGRGMIRNDRGSLGEVKSIFTVSTVEADDRIKQTVREQEPSTETVVITRDRDILACCRDHGVRFEKPEFLMKNNRKGQRPAGETDPMNVKEKKEISNWYRDALKNKGTI